MMLRSVRMHDFGLYGGDNAFDLVPRGRTGAKAKPIVLIGGRNGAGKTTLLEAVRLALYGKRALGARVAQSQYDEHLRKRIHQGRGATSACVEIEFDYAEAGVVHRYHVSRGWSARGKGVQEHLQVEKDGAPVSSVPREEWHQFLQELVPPGVSQLFFFDGEKIQEIAEGGDDDAQLAEAVRGLLGIELVGRLRSDLGLFLARHTRGEGSDIVPRLDATNREIAGLETRAAALAEEVAEITSTRESQARAAEQMRLRFVAEGGDEAARRGQIEAERDEAERAIARAGHELRDLANKLLPFTVAPKLVESFREGLARTGVGGERGRTAQSFTEALLAWRAMSAPERKASWNVQHWGDLERFVSAWTGETDGSTPAAFIEVGDGRAALERLSEAEAIAGPRALALARDLEGHLARLDRTEKALLRADNAAAGLLLDELRLAEQKVGATEAALHARQSELALARGQLVTLRRDQKRLLDAQAAGHSFVEKANLAARAAQALATYETRLLAQKLGRLETEFVGRFNHLARKKDLVASVRIDPITFGTTLFDAQGHDVPKARLSAGEKQIYAIAMLWALARTSGRPLPMIIDTPLGRLDKEHRRNLIQEYFPAASHQVILLSTDTEVDDALLGDLSGAVSHAYRLDYTPGEGRTRIVEGYFDDGGQEEHGRALQQA